MIIHRINWGIYMRNKNNMHRGFTLAEMMIVMLILTIILAAFAPLMTKRKTVRSGLLNICFGTSKGRIFHHTNSQTRYRLLRKTG